MVGTGLGAVGADVVLLEQDYEIALNNVTINEDGVVETPAATGGLLESVGNLTMTGGQFLMQDPGDSLTIVNDSVVTAQSDAVGNPAQITGGTLNISTSFGFPTTFDVSNNVLEPVSPNLVVTAQINDFGSGLNLTGTGTLDLANDSPALTGPITIQSGDLQVNGDIFDPSEFSTVAVNSGGTISSGSGPNVAVVGLITPSTTVFNSISGASDTDPIEILTTSTTGLVNGDMVTISGVGGDTAANGTWFVDVLSSNTFTLYQDYVLGVFSGPVDGTASGTYTSGGTWALDSFIAPADGSLANANANAGTGFSLQTTVGSGEETWNSATTYSVALNDPSTGGFSSLLNVSGQGATVAAGNIVTITDDGLGDPFTVTTDNTTNLQTGDFVTIFGTGGPYDGTGDGAFDGTYQVSVDSLSGTITGATNASPITIATPINATSGMFDGDQVTISGVGGNTAANGVYYVGNVTFDSFQLYQDSGLTIPVVGNGVYSGANGGGTWVDTAPVSGETTFTLNGTGDFAAAASGSAVWIADASLNLNNANLNIAAATSVALLDNSDNPNVIPIIEATTPGANIVGQFAESSIIVGNGGTGQEFDVVYNYPGITYNGNAVSNVVLLRTQEQATVNLTSYNLGSNTPTDVQQQESKVVTLPYGEDQTLTAMVAPQDPNDAPIPLSDSVTFQITGIDNNGGVYLLGSVDVPLSLVGGVMEATTTLGALTSGNAVAPTDLPGNILNTYADNQSPNATPSYYIQYVINAYFNYSGSDPNYLPRTSAALDPTFTQDRLDHDGDDVGVTGVVGLWPAGGVHGDDHAGGGGGHAVGGDGVTGRDGGVPPGQRRLRRPCMLRIHCLQGDLGTVSNGTASWTPTNMTNGAVNDLYANALLPAGTHKLQAIYTTDGNYSVANINNQQVQVLKDTVSVVLTEANGDYDANLGDTLTFQATVSPQAQGSTGVPTGSVFFYYTNSSGNTLFLIGGGGQSLVFNGSEDVAQVTISNLPAGVHQIYAEYGGDTNYLSNVVSNVVENEVPLQEVVGQGTTQTTVTLPAALGTSPNYTQYFGQVVSITATVVGSGAFGVPTGTVEFEIVYPGNPNPVPVGTVSVFASGGNGEAIFSTASLPAALNSDDNPTPDVYTILADYQGSASGNYASSLSTPLVNLTVNPAVTTTTLSSFGSALQYGQAVTLSATVVVAHNQGVGTPDGTVSFILEGAGGGTLGTSPLNGSGVATLAVSSLSTPLELGTNDIYAQYNADAGDYNYSQSASPVAPINAPNEGVVQVVQASTQLALTGVGTAVAGQLLTFTATITAPASSQAPVGTVNFYSGSISNPPLVGTTSSPIYVGNTLEYTFTPATSLSVGTHAIIAQFVATAEPNPPDPQNNVDFTTSSASSTETVNKASTQTVIEATGPIGVAYGVPLTSLKHRGGGGADGGRGCADGDGGLLLQRQQRSGQQHLDDGSDDPGVERDAGGGDVHDHGAVPGRQQLPDEPGQQFVGDRGGSGGDDDDAAGGSGGGGSGLDLDVHGDGVGDGSDADVGDGELLQGPQSDQPAGHRQCQRQRPGDVCHQRLDDGDLRHPGQLRAGQRQL